ncbi:hypothetical protein ElyMa_006231300 [Elysia marginata]|uniref:Uncharacterized protein n=1 Tax=Elysia marginata TaxID=1093978 RepID=A0AAV4H7M8_9GAST|nr:hypothetical protein ElyMa_006231300 [Elysia marginata]
MKKATLLSKQKAVVRRTKKDKLLHDLNVLELKLSNTTGESLALLQKQFSNGFSTTNQKEKLKKETSGYIWNTKQITCRAPMRLVAGRNKGLFNFKLDNLNTWPGWRPGRGSSPFSAISPSTMQNWALVRGTRDGVRPDRKLDGATFWVGWW